MTTPDGPALLHLPVVYAVALALRDAGLAMDEIAVRLELPTEAMPALLEIADAKLLNLRGQTRVQTDVPHGPSPA